MACRSEGVLTASRGQAVLFTFCAFISLGCADLALSIVNENTGAKADYIILLNPLAWGPPPYSISSFRRSKQKLDPRIIFLWHHEAFRDYRSVVALLPSWRRGATEMSHNKNSLRVSNPHTTSDARTSLTDTRCFDKKNHSKKLNCGMVLRETLFGRFPWNHDRGVGCVLLRVNTVLTPRRWECHVICARLIKVILLNFYVKRCRRACIPCELYALF